MSRLNQIEDKLNILRKEAFRKKIEFVAFLAEIVFDQSYKEISDDLWDDLNYSLLLQDQMFFCLFMTKNEVIRFIDLYDQKDQDLCDEEAEILNGTFIYDEDPKPTLRLIK